MYRYFLGAFGNKSFIRPQYEIMEDGKLRGIEDRWGEFPNGGTVSLTGISDSDTESIKNRLLQFKIDFNRDLHPGYAPYTDNSNKYQIPFNAIDDFDKDEVVEIIDIDYAIEDFINDKTKRTIRIKHRPNKQILLRYAQDCYGPFEFMISDIEDSYGDESYYTIKVFVNSGTINRYRNSDIEKIIMDGYFSIRRNDRIEFIYNISDLKAIEPEEKIEYIDNEELADFFKTLLNKSSEIDNLAGIREQFLELADSFSEEGQLTDNRIKRICELLQTSVDLSDYKVRLTEEYFKNNPNAKSDKEEYLRTHEELLTNVVREDVHYEEKKKEILSELNILEKKREVVKDESQYYVCVSHHDAIIDKQTFEYVQQLQENRKSINDKNEVKVPFKYSNQNIFSNKIFCGYCNASYRRIKRKNDSIYYKCSTADKKKRVFCPESENIKEEALKDIIKQTAQYFKVNEEDIIRQFEDVLKEIEMDLDEDSIQGIEEKIQSNRSKLEKLVDLYMEGLIDKEIYFHKKEEIEKETYELNQKMNMTSQTQVSVIQKVKNLIETIKDKLNHWRDMSDTLIKELIYKIVVYSKEKLDIYINVASYQKISYENGVFVLPNVSEME